MAVERVHAQKAMPVRPVPSLKPRDPAVDAPDYLLISKSRLEDLIDFLIKNKARSSFRFSPPCRALCSRIVLSFSPLPDPLSSLF